MVDREEPDAAQEAGDTAWRTVLDAEAQHGVDTDEAVKRFRARTGLEPDEAAASELLEYRDGLDDTGGWAAPRSPDYTFTPNVGPMDTLDDDWVRVEDGDLEQPIHVKFGRAGARFAIRALHIDNGQEITGRALRFRLRAIAEQFARNYSDAGPSGRARYEYKDDPESMWIGWALMDQFVREHVPTVAPKRGRGANPPTVQEYKIFARMYLEEYADDPRGALQRSAERYGMHRITAGKWLKRCQEMDLVPKETR